MYRQKFAFIYCSDIYGVFLRLSCSLRAISILHFRDVLFLWPCNSVNVFVSVSIVVNVLISIFIFPIEWCLATVISFVVLIIVCTTHFIDASGVMHDVDDVTDAEVLVAERSSCVWYCSLFRCTVIFPLMSLLESSFIRTFSTYSMQKSCCRLGMQ